MSLRPVARDGVLAALAVVVLLVGVGFTQLFSTMPLAMAADGLTELDFGLVVSVNGVLIVLVGLPAAAWMGRHQTGWPLPTAVALIAVGLALQAPAHTLAAYAACALVWTVGEMAFLPIVPTLVSRLAPDGLRGSYQGVYHGAWGLAKTLGPALGGWVLAGAGASALWLGGEQPGGRCGRVSGVGCCRRSAGESSELPQTHRLAPSRRLDARCARRNAPASGSELGQERFDLDEEFRNVHRRGLPHQTQIDIVVPVDQAVAHPSHLRPRHVGVRRPHVV